VRRLPETWLPLAAAFVSVCLWGSMFVGIRVADRSFSPGALALGRLSLGTVLLGVLLLFQGSVRPSRREAGLLLRQVLVAAGGEGCYVFALAPDGGRAVTARFFNPVAGIPEDPATGSAAGALACYLNRYGVLKGDHLHIAQGAETGRPSELEIELRGNDVLLRGKAVVVADGVLHVPAHIVPS
jgi:trans-2,3-dihydro-3-hydroxyanthranilate isomerase